MFTRVLVLLDGSARAEQALPLAARIVRASGGTLMLYRVAPMPGAYGALYLDAGGAMVNQALIDEEMTTAQTYLTNLKHSATLSGIPVETLVDSGVPASLILARAEAWHVDLIVMCSHGRSGVDRWILGSVAEHIARHAPAPVLIMHSDGTLPLDVHTPQHTPLRVLVPLDGSQLAEAALEPAIALATALCAPSVCMLHLSLVVNPLDVLVGEGSEDLMLEGAKSYLRRVTNELKESHPHCSITWSVAVNADVATGILHTVEWGEDTEGAAPFGGCDLIAMATHGRTGFNRWAMGSIAERVLHATTRPTLLVRPLRTQASQVSDHSVVANANDMVADNGTAEHVAAGHESKQ